MSLIKTPQEISQEFLDNLKALKPELNTDQIDSDWYIKALVVGGVVSGISSDLNKISNDAFPQSARREAVDLHLQTWTGAGLRPAQLADGLVSVTGTNASIVIPAGTQFIHGPTNNVYNSSEEVTLVGFTGEIPVISVIAGANQNLNAATQLTIQGPPTGLNNIGVVVSPGITNGSDAETTAAGAARVLQLIQSEKRGATESDYIAWGLAASTSVSSVKIRRFLYGIGTVGVIISSGTLDIDTAVDNDETISFTPSAALLATVNTYINAVKPLTDYAVCTGAIDYPLVIYVSVRWVDGDKNTIVADAGVSQGTLLEREIKRAIYNMPVGGTLTDAGQNLVFVADVERQIDTALNENVGTKYKIVRDRQCLFDLGAIEFILNNTYKPVPGPIYITEL